MMKRLVIAMAAWTALTLAGETPKPVAHWALNEGEGTEIKDTGSAAALPGAVHYAANTEWGEGRSGGKALVFKGDPGTARKGGTVRIPLKGAFDPTRPFTLSCWIKPESLAKMPRPKLYEILSTTISDKGPGIRLVLSWNEATFMTGSGAALRAKSAKFPVPREVWSHLAVTFDGKQTKLYVNGALAAATAEGDTKMPTKGLDYLSVGSYKGGYAYCFLGGIGDIKLFNQALSDAEVMAEAKGIDLEE